MRVFLGLAALTLGCTPHATPPAAPSATDGAPTQRASGEDVGAVARAAEGERQFTLALGYRFYGQRERPQITAALRLPDAFAPVAGDVGAFADSDGARVEVTYRDRLFEAPPLACSVGPDDLATGVGDDGAWAIGLLDAQRGPSRVGACLSSTTAWSVSAAGKGIGWVRLECRASLPADADDPRRQARAMLAMCRTLRVLSADGFRDL